MNTKGNKYGGRTKGLTNHYTKIIKSKSYSEIY